MSSRFKIGAETALDIRGDLTINGGVKVVNSGTIVVENVDGIPVVPYMDDNLWKPGLRVLGALDNSGTITIANVVEGTEGITLSYSLNLPADTLSPDVVVRGALTNSGTILIRNQNQSRGIKNVGILANSASGIISVENSIANSAGIYNKRDGNEALPSTFKIEGILTNAGSIMVSNSGDCGPTAESSDPCGYGLYNQGLFTISATGNFVINPSPVSGDFARGLFNGGSITNYGTFINDRGAFTDLGQIWGSFNIGAMINYGMTYAKGTWANGNVMINLGTVTNGTETSYGVMYDVSAGHTMLNYGTIYNYGRIEAGVNYGVCIDRAWTDADGYSHAGSGC